jgi:hypothetical protein
VDGYGDEITARGRPVFDATWATIRKLSGGGPHKTAASRAILAGRTQRLAGYCSQVSTAISGRSKLVTLLMA